MDNLCFVWGGVVVCLHAANTLLSAAPGNIERTERKRASELGRLVVSSKRTEWLLIGNQKQQSWTTAEKEQRAVRRPWSASLDHDKGKGTGPCVTP